VCAYLKNISVIIIYMNETNEVEAIGIYNILNSDIKPETKLLIFILCDIALKVLHKNDSGQYQFDINDENDETNKKIMQWYDIVHKLCIITNYAMFKINQKKLYTLIKYICKQIGDDTNIGIKLTSKMYSINRDGRKSTKIVHFISGINI